MRTITLKINAGAKMCGDCEYLRIFSTGLLYESHPTCAIFHANGKWGARDMKRPKECLKAEKGEK